MTEDQNKAGEGPEGMEWMNEWPGVPEARKWIELTPGAGPYAIKRGIWDLSDRLTYPKDVRAEPDGDLTIEWQCADGHVLEAYYPSHKDEECTYAVTCKDRILRTGLLYIGPHALPDWCTYIPHYFGCPWCDPDGVLKPDMDKFPW